MQLRVDRDAFAEAVAAYGRGSRERAGEAFARLRERYPEDGPTRFYAQRCLEAAATSGPAMASQ